MPRCKTASTLVYILLCVASGAASGSPEAVGDDVRIAVSVSVPPLAYFVERIGGDRVETQVMIPPGAVPATYAPRPQQLEKLNASRAYVLVGHPHFTFERTHVLPYLARHPDMRIIDMTSLAGAGGHAEDPHVWLSIRQVDRTASAIARALAELDPRHQPAFEERLRVFRQEVSRLDGEIRGHLKSGETRSFMVLHPAWGWFAADYGLEQIAIEHEGKLPGPRQLIPLIERARRDQVSRIFVQRGFSHRSADVIAAEIDAEVLELDPLARDWAQNMREASILISGGTLSRKEAP